jgi:hypothetical protein
LDCPIRRESLIVVAASLFLSSPLFAESVDLSQARTAADTFLKMYAAHPNRSRSTVSAASTEGAGATELTAAGIRELRDDDGTVLVYVTDLKPRGFVAMSADTDIVPVIAYSFHSPFPADQDKTNPLYRMLREDMRLRTLALAEHPELKDIKAGGLWTSYVSAQADDPSGAAFQQWPPEGTTVTGGWLETAWNQDAPYNQFCPLDSVDHTRSYTGCTATAIAQIANYHRRCPSDFSQSDSYTAAYGGMKIDGDSTLYDFPTFVKLNRYLAAIRTRFGQGRDLNDVDVAALSFACGVAAKTDYSSEGSGVWPGGERDALLGKLGFYSADMFGGLSADTYLVLQENVVNRLPALLSLYFADEEAGHLLVCDGYNTNDEYHLNFGWGSDAPDKITEVWYHLPSRLLSNDVLVTEVLLNLQPDRPDLEADPAAMTFHSAPGEDSAVQSLRLVNNVAGVQVTSISSPDGFVIARSAEDFSSRLDSFAMGPAGSGETISVKFRPEQAGGYYGTLAIQYGNGKMKHVVLNGSSYAGGTQVVAGNVSGTWSLAGSPYFVTGDIQVPARATLTIEPGVKVFFTGSFGMTIGRDATLTACGSAGSPIEFTAWNKDSGWTGLRFVNSGDDDALSYCSITLARKGAVLIPQDESTVAAPEDTEGGAIFCSSSHPTVENCKIMDNVGDLGGGIYCIDSSPVIRNTVIANNASFGGALRAGGFFCDESGVPELTNCTVVNNSPGGIAATSWDGMDVTNSIVWGNEVYQIQTRECLPAVSFCDVQGGYPGEGNMNVDPCFFDPSAGVGIDYDGSSADWALQTRSPCINSGTQVADLPSTDLAGGSRIQSNVVDVGAYENQSSVSLMTISPSVTADAGFTPVDTPSTVQLDIENTGTGDFIIESVSMPDANGVFSLLTPIQDRILSPGDWAQVEVEFRPRDQKSYAAALDIRSTAENGAHRQITLHGVGVAGTVVSGPSVSGTWRKAQSPYVITGDIRVPRNKTLTIEPGVVVKFAGRFSLTVGYRATLRANGTEQDRILFTASDTDSGWRGIRFINTGTDDTLTYCTLEYANKAWDSGGGFYDLFGGAILCCASQDEDPGVPFASSPKIDSCLLAHNRARTGGAIMCTDDSEAIITNSAIVENSADFDGGGITTYYYAYCTVANNVIARNSAGIAGGGLMNWFSCPSITNNTIVGNRPSAMYLDVTTDQTYIPETCKIASNIIWANEIYMSGDVRAKEYSIQYNDIQGAWPGVGNVDVDPRFADPSEGDYHLKSTAGRWDPATRSWVKDDVSSPCIDAGDPSADVGDEPQPNGQRINMGAYGGTGQASKSPGQ